jgi:hypothetical protein
VIEKIREWLRNTGKDQRFVDAANCLFVHYIFGVLKEDLFHKDNRTFFLRKNTLLENMMKNRVFLTTIEMAKREYFTLPESFLLILLSKRYYLFVSVLLTIFFKLF